jgi:hypothetical protein
MTSSSRNHAPYHYGSMAAAFLFIIGGRVMNPGMRRDDR